MAIETKTPFVVEQAQGAGPAFLLDSRFAPGNVFFVQSTHAGAADAAGRGRTPSQPLATIDYAVGLCTAGQGDLIIVLPGHVETVSAAGGLDLDVAGITIQGIGEGSLRPTINFTNTAATVDVDADNVTIRHMRFKCSVDSLVIGLDIDKKFCLVEDCQFVESATDTNALIWIDIAGSGDNTCDDCTIRRCSIINDAAGASHAIKITNVHARLRIIENYIEGDFSTAAIGSGAILTNVLIADNYISNVNAGDFCVELTAAATGLLLNNRFFADAVDTCLDPGSLKCVGNRGQFGIDAADLPIPFTAEPMLGFHVARATADILTSAAVPVFTISGGRVLVTLLLAEVTTVIGTGTTPELKFQSNPTGAPTTSNLCGTLDIADDPVGTLYTVHGTIATALQRGECGAVPGATAPQILPVGQIEALCDEDVTGSIKLDIWYIPLDHGAKIVAA